MRPIATDVARHVVHVSVTTLITRIVLRKTDEMPFWGLSHVGPRNHVLDGGQDGTNPFAAWRGDNSAIRPFVKIL